MSDNILCDSKLKKKESDAKLMQFELSRIPSSAGLDRVRALEIRTLNVDLTMNVLKSEFFSVNFIATKY